MAYSKVEDLLIGDMPVGVLTSKQKFVNDATNEIDSYIGVRYETPLNLEDTDPDTGWPNPIPRHVRLHIARINNHLASGRLILAVSAGGEDFQVQAYGRSLIEEAVLALRQIQDGSYDIEGAVQNPTEGEQRPRGPIIHNDDSESLIEGFYSLVSGRQPHQSLPNHLTPYDGS